MCAVLVALSWSAVPCCQLSIAPWFVTGMCGMEDTVSGDVRVQSSLVGLESASVTVLVIVCCCSRNA
eukprot:409716-Alexandrium_andersonii.AAC.1